MTIKLANGEYSCAWKCPGCGRVQKDSVHPTQGPFVSCTCGACGRTFHDHHLDAASLRSWEDARTAAENDPAAQSPVYLDGTAKDG